MKKPCSKETKAPNLKPTAFLLAVAFVGCTSTKAPEARSTPEPSHAPEVVAAEKLFEQGKVQDSITATIDITRKNPGARGLNTLQAKLSDYLAKERADAAAAQSASTIKASSADAERFASLPETYRAINHVVGETNSLRTVSTEMQKVLHQPISVNLTDANINAFIAQIAHSTNINIIADSALNASEAKITIKAEETPLIEILDYVGRNLGVTFSIGENIIWATVRDETETALPMETRVYRLRKGLTGAELGKSIQGLTPFKGAVSSRDGGKSEAPNLQEKKEKQKVQVALLEAIERFIPQPESADLYYNDKSHVLIVKNTKENLAKTEEIIDALDIRPLQVLIEARFISTKVTDLKDLGIDWLMQQPSKYTGKSDIDNTLVTELTTRFRRLAADTTTDDNGDYKVTDDALISLADKIKNLSPTTIGEDQGAASIGASGGNVVYQTILNNTGLQATLNALKEDGQSRTLFVPRVTTLNNKEATVRVGEDTVYYDDVDAQSTTTTGYGNSSGYHDVQMRYNTPARLETGCTLVVTPSVGSDLSTIDILLRPEISDVVKWEEYVISTTTYKDQHGQLHTPTIKIPTVSRQYVETEAVVRSGETVVLGGLVRSTRQESTTKTPWLADLPLIGSLFKHETTDNSTENLLIFVTATLISDSGTGLIPLSDMERYGNVPTAEASKPHILRRGAASAPVMIPNATNELLPVAEPVSHSVAEPAPLPPVGDAATRVQAPPAPVVAEKPAAAAIAPAVPAAPAAAKANP